MGSRPYFYHSDPLGSPVVITNSSGDALERYHYYPFGNISSHTGSLANTHKFTGKELDSETGLGLYYYGARYYDPGIGRFITPDPGQPDLNDPQTLNPYIYCTNNPLRYIDPDGQRPFTPKELEATREAIKEAERVYFAELARVEADYGKEFTSQSPEEIAAVNVRVKIEGVPE